MSTWNHLVAPGMNAAMMQAQLLSGPPNRLVASISDGPASGESVPPPFGLGELTQMIGIDSSSPPDFLSMLTRSLTGLMGPSMSNRPQVETRPAPEGPAYVHPRFPGIECVHSPSPRSVRQAETDLFGDLVPVVHRHARDLRLWMASKVSTFEDQSYSEISDAARFFAWLMYREADLQMAETMSGKAMGWLIDSIRLLRAWHTFAADNDSAEADRIKEVMVLWSQRHDAWSAVASGRIHAAGFFEDADALLDERTNKVAELLCAGGLTLLDNAAQLDEWGYPVFAHHILHYGPEAAFKRAAEIFLDLQMQSEAETANDLLHNSLEIHDRTHWAIYQAPTWTPRRSEDRHDILTPNSVIIRSAAADVASYLGMEPLDAREIFESIRPEGHLFPIQTAVERLQVLRHEFEESGEESLFDRTAFLMASSFNFYNLIRELTDQIGTEVPRYLRALLNGFAGHMLEVGERFDEVEMAGERVHSNTSDFIEWRVRQALFLLNKEMSLRDTEPSVDELTSYVEGLRFLMDHGYVGLAHDLIIDLEGGMALVPEALKSMHEEIHRAL